ncbi:MAG: hypothetical protein HYW97_01795 [Candidatus Wildermuthbacteria bacterium]|nr:hypothetical protein [Candidatus Wildermuthbacteria bacterium]
MTITFENLDAENIQLLYDFCTGVYLDGECYAFAIALQQNLGWPIMGLIHKGTIRHALLQRPDGGLFDARGPVKSKDAGKPFEVPHPYDLKPVEEIDLRKIRPIQELSITRALDIAQRIWPDLPWQNSMHERARRFAEELEALSRKYGVWIYARVPAAQPFLTLAHGDETGYALSTALSGGICVFNRIPS